VAFQSQTLHDAYLSIECYGSHGYRVNTTFRGFSASPDIFAVPDKDIEGLEYLDLMENFQAECSILQVSDHALCPSRAP